MKIYVAAKWCDRELVRQLYEYLRKNGHRITVDWTSHEYPDEIDEGSVKYNAFLTNWAMLDIQGVRDCDVLIALFQEPRHQRGAMIEVGAGLGLGKKVIVVGKAENSSTLLFHPLVTKVDTLDEAIERVGWEA
jgi:hypothetical protein